MDTLHIDVKGWPPEWVDMLKNYADGLGAKFESNGLKLPGTPKERLPDWPGIASVPPNKLSRDKVYKEEGE